MLINFTLLKLILGFIIFVLLSMNLSVYLFLSLEEIIVSIRNYNFPRAKTCSYKDCGFYYHRNEDPESKDCLNPFISPTAFRHRSRGGNNRGCRRSMQVREIHGKRKPASAYKKEYLATYSAFHISKVWWRVMTILAAIGMYLLSLPIFDNFWNKFLAH